MNSRERVLAAVNHRPPDRVPVDLGFAPELKTALCGHLGVTDAQFWTWVGQDLAYVGARFKHEATPKCYADPTIEVTAEGHHLDIFRVPFREVRTQFQTYMELVGRPPLAACEDVEELTRFPWPSPVAWSYEHIAETLRRHEGQATIGHSRGFFEISHFMRGMDNFMADLAAEPEFAAALMDHIAEYLLEKARRALEAGDGGYTLFEYNDDVAAQQGLFISPTMWRHFNKPRMARFCELYHRHGAKVRYHSCGSVRAIIPDLIEIGVDILNPVQAKATGMDPFELKREFGKDLTFHGGVDIQELLPRASASEVREHTRRLLGELGRDGGYILGGSHTLQADIPVENVVAMVEEAVH
jgi:uroporphyrinogen decarboxylase